MQVLFIDHARQRMVERGASEADVQRVLETGQAEEERAARWAKEAVLPYNAEWQGKTYDQKKVRVIYLEEGDQLVVITVYVYYGRWEQP